ncbi:MAG: hypothetical protein Q7T16_03680 [Candidatus Burarchaeum sp.]|nr:hypothetical protein [Candidatus Burarchaeum sp.]MDO8339732.1 hypothetical protein [Candidatus Burarchaeum sp.]
MNFKLALAALMLLLAAPLAYAVTYSSVIVEPNQLTALSNDGGGAAAIIYSTTNSSAQAAFVSKTLLVSDGMRLENNDLVRVEFEGSALKLIGVGGEPDRSGYVTLPVRGETGGMNISQNIYSQLNGYEAIFTPAIPASLAGKRAWIEYSNEFWLIGDMNASSHSILLYQEAAYGTIDYNHTLATGSVGLQFVGLDEDTGNPIVRFRAGNEPTFMTVREEFDIENKLASFWVDYNTSAGIILNADCYTSGGMKGSLEFVNNRYRGRLDYGALPPMELFYTISCSKEGYESQTEPRFLNLTVAPTASSPGAQLPAVVPSPPAQAPQQAPAVPEITGQPYVPAPQPQQPTNFFDWLFQFLRNPFAWLWQ